MKTDRLVTIEGKTQKRNVLIEEYYNSRPEFSDIEYKRFEQICKTPFRHARRKLSEGILYDIRLRYLGQFCPAVSSVIYMLKLTQSRYDKELIMEKTYNEMIKTLTDYIRKKPEQFEPYKEKIKRWISLK